MVTTIIVFIAVLSILVFVHELGHFLMARRMGVKVEEFGFGFPPRLIGVKRGDTTYSINWVPIGGFVKIKGEQGGQVEEEDSFTHKKIWQRFLILSAGVAMNVLLAFFLISIGFMAGLPAVIDENELQGAHVRDLKTQIVEVREDSPAKSADVRIGDVLLSVDGIAIQHVRDFQSYTKDKLNEPVTLRLRRGTEEIEKQVAPQILNNSERPVIGIGLVETGLVSYPIYRAVWEGAKTTGILTWRIIEAFYTVLKNLMTGQPVGADIAGPVGIAVLTGQVVDLGFIYILQFIALLSINLAIINFLPFPALDGGRVFFLLIEKIHGRAVNRKIEAIIHNIGFAFLILLIVFVTFRDVSRFGEQIKNFFQNLL